MRPTVSKGLLAVGGALLGGTICWIALGLLSGGDFFAQGRVISLAWVIAAAAAGAYVGGKATTRGARGALVAGDLLCLLFWIAAPDGWWATSPPPPPSVEGAPHR